MFLALRAASTTNLPDPPPPIQDTATTFVKITNPTERTTSSADTFSSPLDLSQPVVDSIPEPPSLPVAEITEALNAAGEPAFETMGLGGWTPVGIVQNCLEYLHIACDLPWWTSIVIGNKCFLLINMSPLMGNIGSYHTSTFSYILT